MLGQTAAVTTDEIHLADDDADSTTDTETTIHSDDVRQDTETAGADEVNQLEEPHRPWVPLTDCIRCFDTLPRDDAYRSPCGCYYCEDCVNWLFRQSMTDVELYPPRCCHQPMPLDDVLPLLTRKLAREFRNKQEELDDQNKAYCHRPTCSTYVPVVNRKDNIADCPLCQTETCLRCRGPGHSGACPTDEDVQEILTMAEQRGWQRCGNTRDEGCGQMISISTGCNHMT